MDLHEMALLLWNFENMAKCHTQLGCILSSGLTKSALFINQSMVKRIQDGEKCLNNTQVVYYVPIELHFFHNWHFLDCEHFSLYEIAVKPIYYEE